MRPQISNSVIRDNVRDNRLIPVNDHLFKIINSREFQRLRSIKQMGLGSFAFPTADHSRFSHSIGVYGTAFETFRNLRAKAEPLSISFPAMQFDDDAEKDFVVSAMCHDVGHTAFSHVLENVLLPNGMKHHEECTLALLDDASTEIYQTINRYADIEAVRLFIKRSHPNQALGQLVSGPYDVDRSDYLIRDSLNAGVHYGTFDVQWLQHALAVDLNKIGQPILLLDGPRGLDALSQFLSARRYMYRHVYFHPTVRAAQLLLKSIFDRLATHPADQSLVDLAPDGLKPILKKSDVSIGNFLETTDVEVTYLIRTIAKYAKDDVLKYLAERFVKREFPKCILDSTKNHKGLKDSYGVETEAESGDIQMSLSKEFMPRRLDDIIEQCAKEIASKLKQDGKNEDIAPYIINSDPLQFKADASAEFIFSYQGRNVALDDIDDEDVVFNLPNLLRSFRVHRIFAAYDYKDHMKHFVSNILKNQGLR